MTVGIKTPLISSFGRNWIDFVADFDAKGTAFFNSDEHVRPLTPNRETVKEVLIFRLLSCYDSSVISELKPMDGVHEFKGKTKLAISFYFYMLNKSVETHIEQEWTKTIALKYATTDWNKRGLKT